jgi:coproporphyrinogen III oxidase-like Fe-S oxidoreductase
MPIGWRFDEFQGITGYDLREGWADEMRKLVACSWAEMDEESFRLTPQGLRFADSAAEEFLRVPERESVA